jgi:hypothetical protein
MLDDVICGVPDDTDVADDADLILVHKHQRTIGVNHELLSVVCRTIALSFCFAFVDELSALGMLLPTLTWIMINAGICIYPTGATENPHYSPDQKED